MQKYIGKTKKLLTGSAPCKEFFGLIKLVEYFFTAVTGGVCGVCVRAGCGVWTSDNP